ncbi:MAG TPA: MraY family glycosyltransferase [Pirellulales bacterium]|jgi:UDP-GlcNAc:undecaprenyl-phosphate GlcNAc-1-phosphate transferase|nr:MraY family glycosyltransferase [Pirellulales bacterium]
MTPADLLLIFAAFVGSVVMTAVVRALALRYGVTDHPDGRRKLQAAPVPLWGGVSVFGVFLAVAAIAWAMAPEQFESTQQLAAMLVASASLVFFIGLIDDSFELAARTKLVLQIAAALPVVCAVHWFDRAIVFGHEFELGVLAWPLTLLWLVGCVNAMNLLDGMDGSASVVSIVAAAAIAGIALHHEHFLISSLAAILAASVLGFLVYNRPPASIYLGDCGSTVIGLLLAVLCMEGATLADGALRLAVPSVVLAIPILDTLLAVMRRRLTGRRFDCADRGHIHHRLLERGMHKWQALGLIAVVSIVLGAGGLAAAVLNSEPLAWLTVLAVVVAMTHLRYFGNHEWSLLKMSIAAKLSRAASNRWARSAALHSPNRRAITSLRFDDSWSGLTRELVHWPAQQLEFALWQGRQRRFVQVWQSNSTLHIERHHWRIALTFDAADGSRVDLSLAGDDALSAEPWYLPRLTAVLERFGRHWAARPGQLRLQQLGIYEAASADQRRAA